MIQVLHSFTSLDNPHLEFNLTPSLSGTTTQGENLARLFDRKNQMHRVSFTGCTMSPIDYCCIETWVHGNNSQNASAVVKFTSFIAHTTLYCVWTEHCTSKGTYTESYYTEVSLLLIEIFKYTNFYEILLYQKNATVRVYLYYKNVPCLNVDSVYIYSFYVTSPFIQW